MSIGGSKTWERAIDVIVALITAGDAGVKAGDMPVQRPELGRVARMLRDQGVPIMATRAGEDSRWFLAHPMSEIYLQARERYLMDAYQACISGAKACSVHENSSHLYDVFRSTAIQLALQMPVDSRPDWESDLTMDAMPEALRSALVRTGYLTA